MTNKTIIIFAEGETEIEFYKAVIKRAHDLLGRAFTCEIKFIDMKGISSGKDIVLRKFKHLKREFVEKDIYVFLCIDSDAFHLSKKPPFDKDKLSEELRNAGAKQVKYIIAKQSIEDWFLIDFDGVLKYLHLTKPKKRPKGVGQDVIRQLFKQASKVYVKGGNTKDFIKKLDISKIMDSCCGTLNSLCQILGLDCKKICKKSNNN